jgi:hypothetical protein
MRPFKLIFGHFSSKNHRFVTFRKQNHYLNSGPIFHPLGERKIVE